MDAIKVVRFIRVSHISPIAIAIVSIERWKVICSYHYLEVRVLDNNGACRWVMGRYLQLRWCACHPTLGRMLICHPAMTTIISDVMIIIMTIWGCFCCIIIIKLKYGLYSPVVILTLYYHYAVLVLLTTYHNKCWSMGEKSNFGQCCLVAPGSRVSQIIKRLKLIIV